MSAAVPLGAAGEVGSEPVDDARELHQADWIIDERPVRAVGRSSGGLARRSRLDLSAQAGVLDRELLDAGEQDPVEVILAPEVLLAVLEQPPRQRQQQLLLGEQDQPSGGGRADAW